MFNKGIICELKSRIKQQAKFIGELRGLLILYNIKELTTTK